MRKLLIGCAALALAGMAWALDDDVDGWIKDLGSADPKTREAAAENLEKAGERARTALEAAAKSEDPEVASEAGFLLHRLDAGAPRRPAGRRPQGGQGPVIRMSSTRVIVDRDGTTTQVTEDSTGRVIVRETKDGKTETWSADSRDAFTEKYPELAKKYELDKPAEGLQVVPWKGGALEDEEMAKRLEELRKRAEERLRQAEKEMEQEQQELRKALREREGKDGKDAGIGLEIAEVDEALRYQLDLPEGGVLIRSVAAGSRADKVGIRRHDILLTVNGRPVSSAADIRAAFQSDGPATAEVIREGDHQALREQE